MKTQNIRDFQAGAARRSLRSQALPTLQNRDKVEQLMRLAVHLNESDRDLLMAVYNDGTPVRRLCRLLGLRHPSSVARRVRRVLQRLADPQFRFLLQSRHQWSDERQAVAEQVWLRDRSNRQTARELGLSLHRVRQHVAAIKAVLAERDDPPTRDESAASSPRPGTTSRRSSPVNLSCRTTNMI